MAADGGTFDLSYCWDDLIQFPDGWEREGFQPLEREGLQKRWISVYTQGNLLNGRWSTGYQMFWATKRPDTMAD